MLFLIFRNLRYRRLRSWLTVLGIVIGTMLILSLVFLGEGMKAAVAGRLQSFGSDLIYIFPGKEDNPFVSMFGGAELRDKDIDVARDVPGVRVAMPMQTQTARVGFHGEEKPVVIHGSPWVETRLVYEESQGLGLRVGEWPERDTDRRVILGDLAARDRFDTQINVGDTIIARGREFSVSGIFLPTGESATDSMIYFGMEQFRRITGNTTGVNSVVVKISSGYDINDVTADIKTALLSQKGIADFVVLTSEKAENLIGDILGVIQLVLAGIAFVALLVGGVGILNTMFTSVIERTREIGTLKALGATNNKILSLFLIESGFLGATGGMIGAVLSVLVAKLIEFGARNLGYEFLEIPTRPLVIFEVLIFTFVLGIIFGLVPAHQASRLRPTEALRYE